MHEEQRAMLQMLGTSVEDWGWLEPAHSEDDLTGAGAEIERRGAVPTFSVTHTVQQEGWRETWESRKMMRSAKTSSHVSQFRPHVLSNVCGLLVMIACRPRQLSGTIRPRLQRASKQRHQLFDSGSIQIQPVSAPFPPLRRK